MIEALELMETIVKKLDAITQEQGEIRKGRERLKHYDHGTLMLEDALKVITAVLNGQKRANEAYELELNHKCRALELEVARAEDELTVLRYELESARQAEDRAADALMKRIEQAQDSSLDCIRPSDHDEGTGAETGPEEDAEQNHGEDDASGDSENPADEQPDDADDDNRHG